MTFKKKYINNIWFILLNNFLHFSFVLVKFAFFFAKKYLNLALLFIILHFTFIKLKILHELTTKAMLILNFTFFYCKGVSF